MKIMYCITRSNWGGAQAHLFELIKHNKKLGNEICLVVGEKGTLTERVHEVTGVKIVIEKEIQRSVNLLQDVRATLKLRKDIKNFNPNILHLHSSKAGAIGRMAALGLPCRVIFTVHGWAFTDGIKQPKKFIYTVIERFLSKFANKIICVSQFDYQIAVKYHIFKAQDNKGIVVHNGIKIDSWEKVKQDNKCDKFILTMVARFDDQKNQLLLLNSLEKLKKLNIKVNLIGDGPTKERLQQEAQKKSLQKIVNFSGFQKNVSSFLKQADCFILISNYEGLPISILEAMNFQLPIIASNVGGISEEVSNGVNGILVKNETDDIYRAIRFLYKNPNTTLKYGIASKNKVQDDFNLDDMLKRVDIVYRGEGLV